jgi:hypothetical protein
MQIQKLREEYRRDLQESNRIFRQESRDANELMKRDIKKEIEDLKRTLQKESTEANGLLQKDIQNLRAFSEKSIKEINLTLLELQKDFLQNRKVVDDTVRRIYLIESIITARGAIPQVQRDSFIRFLEGKKVVISVGSNNGVNMGDKLSVYKGSTLKHKIGSIKIVDVEMDSSAGEILEQEEKFSIADRVEIER